MYVYKVTNTITGDLYVGKTVGDIDKRYKGHCYAVDSGSDTHFHRAMRKYGKENFLVEELEHCDESNLNDREKYWISELKPSYNMTVGGDGGDTSSSEKYQEYMKKRPLLMSGENNPFFGKKHSAETKEKISQKKKGTVVSEETKQKLRGINLGKKMSAESIRKTAEAKSKIWYLVTPEGNPIVVKNLNEFCRQNNLDQRNMCNMYNGAYKSSKGYKRDIMRDPK